MRERVHRFWLQPTPSFEHGPQREMFATDEELLAAEHAYAKEWRAAYHCYGCSEPACPQCVQVGSRLELGPKDLATNLHDTARFSPDELHRYTLSRVIGTQPRVLASIGLNPSTATAFKNDPTVRRDIGFARMWSCGTLWKGNAYGYRAKEPAAMKRARRGGTDIVGAENDRWLRWICELVRETEGVLWVSWGGNIDPGRQVELAYLFEEEDVVPLCWKVNDDGSPAHELYSPNDLQLERWQCP